MVRWPDQVKPGSKITTPSYFPDWFPTLAKIASAPLETKQILDGIDLTGAMKSGNAPKREQPMVWEFNGYGGIIAIRDGNWKALRRNLRKGKQPLDWELYNLATDPSESKDVASEHPEIVANLETQFLESRTSEPDFPVPFLDNVEK